jgi:hypothetical protein
MESAMVNCETFSVDFVMFTRASFYLHRHVDYDGKGLWNEAILEDDDEVN